MPTEKTRSELWCPWAEDFINVSSSGGTILLSPEGLNGFWAGPEAAAQAFLNLLRGLPGFDGLEAKVSWSDDQPFKRFKVKVKAEIIRTNHPTMDFVREEILFALSFPRLGTGIAGHRK